ncbi:MAG TPA: PKD domain-containing protein [Planctomycetota bacterium]|nr:PKD domain-containing protein [Planctomycetota bacterium]
MKRIVLVCALASAVVSPAVAQFSQTLPVGLDAVDGSSSTGFPFNGTANHIWHWIYDTSNFTANFPIVINAISVRPQASSAGTGGTYQNVEITLASATIDWTVGSTGVQTFASNMAGDATVVFTGPVTLPPGPHTNPGGWVTIPVAPFVYDPTLGADFIIQIRTPGPGNVAAMTLDGHNNGNATRYGHTSNALSAVSNFNNPAFVPVTKIDYTPAAGLFASFNSSPNSGPAALTVNFTDTSFTSTPGGVTGWSWDFDNDGIGDSTLQNPSHTYLAPGTYTVALTVTDGVFSPSTIVKTNLVTVGPYVFDVQTTGGGVGDLIVNGVPSIGSPGAVEGYTFLSFDTSGAFGTGPAFGLRPDATFFSVLTFPAAPGNPLHYVNTPGFYPDVPFVVPAGGLTVFAGLTIDFVQVGLNGSGGLAFWSNPDRATF